MNIKLHDVSVPRCLEGISLWLVDESLTTDFLELNKATKDVVFTRDEQRARIAARTTYGKLFAESECSTILTFKRRNDGNIIIVFMKTSPLWSRSVMTATLYARLHECIFFPDYYLYDVSKA